MMNISLKYFYIYYLFVLKDFMRFVKKIKICLWTSVFHVRPHSMARLTFCVVGKPFLKNGLESPLIFVLF